MPPTKHKERGSYATDTLQHKTRTMHFLLSDERLSRLSVHIQRSRHPGSWNGKKNNRTSPETYLTAYVCTGYDICDSAISEPVKYPLCKRPSSRPLSSPRPPLLFLDSGVYQC